MNKREELTFHTLKELFNISVRKAADILSEIINKKIVLSVPNIRILDIKNNDDRLKNYFPSILDGTLMVSSISFERKLKGKANLIFPVKKMRKFINLCLNNEEEYCNINFINMDFDIIKEIGNTILNCIIGDISDYLSMDLTYTLPEVKVFNKIDFNRDIECNKYTYMLPLYITFKVDSVEIEEAIIIDLTLNSLNELVKKIDKIRDKLYE